MGIYEQMTDLIGGTPLVRLGKVEKAFGISCRLLAKIEGMNPAGSAKDRVALSMIEAAEKTGKISPGATIIEPTSGNTGIGLAAVAAQKGYRAIFVMPDTMSIERRNLLKAYGAEIVLTPGALGMRGAIEKAEEMQKELAGSMIPGQFVNPENPRVHYETTGPEIWQDTQGQVDAFVAGVGTGGTITGTGRFLKEQNPRIRVVAVEPKGSAVLSGKAPGPHGLQGIGAGFVPEILDTEMYDEIIPVTEEEAYEMGRFLAKQEGLLVGISSGAALCGAVAVGKRKEFEEKTLVVLLPDSGERYLSTPMFREEEK